jgi:hypothetical protein
VRGHVDRIARGINVANAQPNGQGVANVNPIFIWVRLAQRIPVRIRSAQWRSFPPRAPGARAFHRCGSERWQNKRRADAVLRYFRQDSPLYGFEY